MMTPQQRLAEIRALYDNRRASRSGKERLWSVIGELLEMIDAPSMEKLIREANPLIALEPLNAIPPTGVGAFEIANRALEASRPPKPPTYTQAQWRALGEEGRAKHFQAVKDYEESLTPAERQALIDADRESEDRRIGGFMEYKSQFDENRPYDPNKPTG